MDRLSLTSASISHALWQRLTSGALTGVPKAWAQRFFSVFLLYHIVHLISRTIRSFSQKFTHRSSPAVWFCVNLPAYKIHYSQNAHFSQNTHSIAKYAFYIFQQKSCGSINYFLILLSSAAIILYNAVERCYISAANIEMTKLCRTQSFYLLYRRDTYGSQLQKTLEITHW